MDSKICAIPQEIMLGPGEKVCVCVLSVCACACVCVLSVCVYMYVCYQCYHYLFSRHP
uniref:Uncharacterized protein n=1 Tax=Anguilla anguilla TaxID=7936 RepID=A0A0E9QK94_ANGAN